MTLPPRLTALIALIAAPPALAEPVVLTDEDTFRAYAVDRPMGFGIGDQEIHADGSVTGEVYGPPGKFTGTWAWREASTAACWTWAARSRPRTAWWSRKSTTKPCAWCGNAVRGGERMSLRSSEE